MKLVSALAGLVALGGVALSVAPASAMPAGMSAQASQSPYVVQAAYVCNEWGHAGTSITTATAITIRTTGTGITGIRIITAAGDMAAGITGTAGPRGDIKRKDHEKGAIGPFRLRHQISGSNR